MSGYLTTLKNRRNELKYSQEFIARTLNISLSGYQKIENGKSIPSVILAKNLAYLLQINIFDVAEWDEEYRERAMNNPLNDLILEQINEKRNEKYEAIKHSMTAKNSEKFTPIRKQKED